MISLTLSYLRKRFRFFERLNDLILNRTPVAVPVRVTQQLPLRRYY